MSDAVTKLDRIWNALAHSILEMTPEELRQSFVDDGEDPDQIVAEQREMICKLLQDRYRPSQIAEVTISADGVSLSENVRGEFVMKMAADTATDGSYPAPAASPESDQG